MVSVKQMLAITMNGLSGLHQFTSFLMGAPRLPSILFFLSLPLPLQRAHTIVIPKNPGL